MTEETKISEGFKRCECGCGQEVKGYNHETHQPTRFKKGHYLRLHSNSLHHNWKGGTRITLAGYRVVLQRGHPRANRDGYVFEHILVKEKEIGRHIAKNEDVHHINGNKLDNRPENLELMTKSQHAITTLTIDMSNRRCSDCGSSETYRRDWQKDPIDKNKIRCHKCYMKFYKLRRKSIIISSPDSA